MKKVLLLTILAVFLIRAGSLLAAPLTGGGYTLTSDSTSTSGATATDGTYTLGSAVGYGFSIRQQGGAAWLESGFLGGFDDVPPSGLNITISDIDGYTGTATPALTLSAMDGGAALGAEGAMRLACTQADLASAPFVTFATGYSSFNIATGPGCLSTDGSRSVYFQARDREGNLQTIPVSDSTFLDTTPPATVPVTDSGPGNADPNDQYSRDTVVWFYSDPTDSGSGVASCEIAVYDNPGLSQAVTSSSAVTPAGDYTFGAGQDGKTYYARIRCTDRVGNIAAWGAASDGIKVDLTLPQLITLLLSAHGIEIPQIDGELLTNAVTIQVSGQVEAGSTVQLNGGSIQVQGDGNFNTDVDLDEGMNTLLFTVSDPAENQVQQSKQVDLDTIAPTAGITAPNNNDQVSGTVAVSGVATDNAHYQGYNLEVGQGDQPQEWRSLAQSAQQFVQAGQLGAWVSDKHAGTYAIRLTVSDKAGNSSTAIINLSVENAKVVTGTIPAGEWTMVSFPGVPLNPNVKNFLPGNFNLRRWDPLTPDQGSPLFRYKTEFAVDAGQGFWIKVYGDPITYELPSAVADTSQPFEENVYQGWNQIGAPYGQSIALGDILVRNQQTLETVTMSEAAQKGWVEGVAYGYTAGGYVQMHDDDIFTPGGGYFFKALADVTLLFAPSDSELWSRIAAARARAKSSSEPDGWGIKLKARSESFVDDENTAGVSNSSRDDIDPADLAEPPVVDDYVSLYFPHPEWGSQSRHWTRDIRKDENSPVVVWNFEVAAGRQEAEAETQRAAAKPDEKNKRLPVEITWEDLDKIPESYKYVLIEDVETGIVYDLKNRERIEFETDAPRRLRLIVSRVPYQGGTPAFEVRSVHVYPNPWSPTTQGWADPVRFYGEMIEEAGANVIITSDVKIYTMDGRLVARLVQNSNQYNAADPTVSLPGGTLGLGAGNPAPIVLAEWDGKNISDQTVASGVYLYRIVMRSGNSNTSAQFQGKLAVVK